MPEIFQENGPPNLSIVLPAYNEEDAIPSVISEVRKAMSIWPGTWEILVVDDASTDQTAKCAEAEGVRVIRRVENGGSGAARKTGTREARGTLVAMLDVDGTYDASHLPELLSYFPDYDQVNGARTSEQGTVKILRTPAKWVIRKLAEWISGKRIPDLNTGMKIFKRNVMLRYFWVIPDGFSCVTSMTLAFLCNGHPVKYVPITYRKRIGRSKFHPVKDTLNYFFTIFRIVMYFRPLRVFFPLTMLIGAVTVAKGVYDWYVSPKHSLQESDVILAAVALIVFVLGMLADLIVAQRREPI